MKRSILNNSSNLHTNKLGALPRQKEALWSLLWLAIICGVAFFWGLSSTGLVDETEPLFAEASRQMYETGDWVTPYFNGTTRFDKPPLVYWLMAIGFHLFGVGEWAVRLPSALSGTVLVGMGFYTLRRFGFSRPERAIAYTQPPTHENTQPLARDSERNLLWSAIIGSAIMALHPETIVWARIGVSDMLLTGCIGTALLTFFLGYAQPEFPQRQRNWYLAAYVSLGLAVLAKGPVGIVLPGLIVGAFFLHTGQWRKAWRELHLVKGAVIFLAITVPWHVLVILANGRAYIDTFFGYHNVDRFTSVVNGHAAPWYFYFLVVAVGFLPWSPFLPWAIARLRPLSINDWQTQPRSTHLGIFAFIWFWVIFGFFTIAVTKLPSYVLPLMPAAAIMVGLGWSDRLCLAPDRLKTGVGFWLSYGVNIFVFIVLAIAALYSPNWMGNDPAMPGLPDLVRESGIMIRAAIIWSLAGLSGIGLLVRRSRWLWFVNLVAFTLFVLGSILPAYQLADQVRQQPLRQIAATAIAEQQMDEPLYMVGFMKPTLVFYTQQPVTYIEQPTELADELTSPTSNNSALVVGTADELQEIQWPPEQQDSLVTTDTYHLVRLFTRN
ncbi:glycosyltransferase family 39 protein [Oscillatoria sp. CS-180]|uniref:ArnT family glycosyltransferase n=1 Tax=Oscillatoria sp. CS-180 TaxID=3021720 RepID=UPI00232D273A|nr:glycosyltransferase family 39 protein [Oscillatoria sp. CS-180]MDB9528813.1 glycosyltransferase family 39 protein [Oscillatoria sp. CS-180]